MVHDELKKNHTWSTKKMNTDLNSPIQLLATRVEIMAEIFPV